jgi:hypothetical protein
MSHRVQKEEKLDSWHKNCLALFPTDVLNMMTGYLNGFSVLALYNCGSGLLNYKLRKNGAVTHFRVRGHVDVFPPHRDWRNHNFKSLCLFQSLTTLELTGFSNYAFRYFGTPIIAGLPPSLQKIRFDFIEALTMWVDVRKSPVPKGHTLSFEPFGLDEFFPKMTSLELSSRFWDRLTIYRGKECIAYNWAPELRERFLEHIPRSVTDLTISISGCTGEFGTKLPQDLRSLKLTIALVHDGPQNFIPSLPRSLQYLDLSQANGIKGGALKDLPPELHTLHLCSVDPESEDFMPTFPACLTALYLSHRASWLNHAAFQANVLPSTLTILSMHECSKDICNDTVQYFPRSLTVLEFALAISNTGSTINEQALMDLPSGLKVLNLASVVELPWSCFELLPRSLQVFTHHSFKYASIPDEPNSSISASQAYWKSQGPPECRYLFTNWNGLSDDERQQRVQQAQRLQQYPVAIPAIAHGVRPHRNDDDDDNDDNDTDTDTHSSQSDSEHSEDEE